MQKDTNGPVLVPILSDPFSGKQIFREPSPKPESLVDPD
jgi:hypothetical protein